MITLTFIMNQVNNLLKVRVTNKIHIPCSPSQFNFHIECSHLYPEDIRLYFIAIEAKDEPFAMSFNQSSKIGQAQVISSITITLKTT